MFGIGLLAYGVSQRWGTLNRAAAPATWDLVKLGEPAGTRVGAVSAQGSAIVLHLYTGNPGTDERLVLLDAVSGKVVGRVAVTGP